VGAPLQGHVHAVQSELQDSTSGLDALLEVPTVELPHVAFEDSHEIAFVCVVL